MGDSPEDAYIATLDHDELSYLACAHALAMTKLRLISRRQRQIDLRRVGRNLCHRPDCTVRLEQVGRGASGHALHVARVALPQSLGPTLAASAPDLRRSRRAARAADPAA